jgi:hypothetical protein
MSTRSTLETVYLLTTPPEFSSRDSKKGQRPTVCCAVIVFVDPNLQHGGMIEDAIDQLIVIRDMMEPDADMEESDEGEVDLLQEWHTRSMPRINIAKRRKISGRK